MNRLTLFLLILLLPLGLAAQSDRKWIQSSDSAYQRPLNEVLNDLQKQFNVRLKVPADLVEGKVLKYADWRLRPWSLEQSLSNVLNPFDLIAVKELEGVYKVKPFDYARRTEADGKQYLDYLQTLYGDLPAWEARKQQLQTEIRQAVGLDPMPMPTGSKPIITGKRVFEGYSVENVALEVLPGVYTMGSVYKPLKARNCPVVINPCGHFFDERYRPDMQYRLATLARMGCIAVSYNLFGWGESMLQFKYEWHRTSIAQTIQTLNAIRWIDYLSALKQADPKRVAITGGSGGGSQTMLVTALDDRITCSIPVVMTSSWFSGGCPCESGLPVHLCCGGTNNAEIAAMSAPRPLLVISDGKDWTEAVPTLEYPFIRRTFAFYGKERLVENAHFPAEGHDYGPSKRQACYAFLAKQWGLNTANLRKPDGSFDESTVRIEQKEALYVFGSDGQGFPKNAVHDLDVLRSVLEASKAATANTPNKN